jgi:hypothetical protein
MAITATFPACTLFRVQAFSAWPSGDWRKYRSPVSSELSVSTKMSVGIYQKLGVKYTYLVWAFYPFYGYLEGPSIVKSKALVSKLWTWICNRINRLIFGLTLTLGVETRAGSCSRGPFRDCFGGRTAFIKRITRPALFKWPTWSWGLLGMMNYSDTSTQKSTNTIQYKWVNVPNRD